MDNLPEEVWKILLIGKKDIFWCVIVALALAGGIVLIGLGIARITG